MKLFKKIKILLIVVVAFVFLTGGLLIWAGYTAVQVASNTFHQVIESKDTQKTMSEIQTTIQSHGFNALNCWNKTQALFTIQPWIENPALENLKSLQVACLNQNEAVCEGSLCKQIKKQNNTSEGDLI